MTIFEKQQYIKSLALKHNAVIMAHYYVSAEIQAIAGYLGDSLHLARQVQLSKNDVILFCGVNFMAETAKILNPNKLVIVPDNTARCSLADSVNAKDCAKWKQSFPNPYLITYINSSIETKALSDVICTSANVLQIVSAAPKNATLLFAPDINLGNWVNKTLGINMELWNGNCIVHQNYDEEALLHLKSKHSALVLAHPECPSNLLRHADFVGSTTAILRHAKQADNDKFIILTEIGVLNQLQQNSPGKQFFFVPAIKQTGDNVCTDMKKHTLDKIISALENLSPSITLEEKLRTSALAPLEKMLALSE